LAQLQMLFHLIAYAPFYSVETHNYCDSYFSLCMHMLLMCNAVVTKTSADGESL